MDRPIIYPGAIPLETDLLKASRDAMVAIATLAKDLLGTATVVGGLQCTATGPASMSVAISPGSIYSLQNLDSTAYSSLGADTTHQIMKQGILLDAVALACPAPTTAGFSIVYLIQATFQEVDANAVVLPYYNAANPAVAFSGPANSGTAQSTDRLGKVLLAAKPGMPAATGTQSAPPPDAGYVGLWYVTVANGQTSITSTSIAQATAAPFISRQPETIDVTSPVFGAVRDGFTDDSPAWILAAAACAGTGRTLYAPYGTYLMRQPIAFDRCKVRGDNILLKFVGLGNSTDCVTLQGSSMAFPLDIDGVQINANGCGRDAVVMAGGSAAAASCDHPKVRNMLIQGAVRDAFHMEPAATNYWIQNVELDHVKALNPGRHGFAMVCGATNTFINNGVMNLVESRGAGQTVAGSYDIYIELAGSTLGQQISSFTWITPEFDVMGAADHAQGSIHINVTGTNVPAIAWTFLSPVFEDTGTVITGNPTVVNVTGTLAFDQGWIVFGLDGSDYGPFCDPTKLKAFVRAAEGTRDLTYTDLGSLGFAASYANDAAAAAAGVPVGYQYRNGSNVCVRVA